MAGYARAHNGAQPGDPIKAAAVIVHIGNLDEPPLRMLLGTDAVHMAEQTDMARIEADKKWRDLSLSTDFEPGGGAKAVGVKMNSEGSCKSPRRIGKNIPF